ncbi:MAG: DUF4163 domain-containing protein [Alteraurantiacibacter sp. bin_em_oilr2.035]|nr:DUF4163 domain-containing protein [Alteraurantiacibacter sp. bin_em_oilr2.035]
MRRLTWALLPIVVLAACEPAGPSAPAVAPSATATGTSGMAPTPSKTTGGDPAPVVGGARQISEQTDTFVFEYSYPAEAGDLPALAAWLDRRLDRQRQNLAREASRGRDDARENGFPFNKYSSGTAWKTVADLPSWLSLSADLDSYRGGAHPNYGFDTIVWDKERDRALEPIAFFTSPAALDAALGERLCDALNAERAERRGERVEGNSTDPFEACIKPDETNLLLSSRSGRSFDRIGIQIAPYLAGPYAEGSYEFSFAVDAEILEIVRPEFRAAFTPED